MGWDHETTCPACGSTNSEIRHRKARRSVSFFGATVRLAKPAALVHRCTTCHYRWERRTVADGGDTISSFRSYE